MKFEYRTLDFPADYDGPVAATLIRASFPAQDTRRAVLYVHGYIDYFSRNTWPKPSSLTAIVSMPWNCANTAVRCGKGNTPISPGRCMNIIPT